MKLASIRALYHEANIDIKSTYSPSTLSILKFLGSSLAYPIFASAASALASLLALATDAFLPAPVWVMLKLRLFVSISYSDSFLRPLNYSVFTPQCGKQVKSENDVQQEKSHVGAVRLSNK